MDEFRLVPGSRYRVASRWAGEEVHEFEGTFRGVTSMGSVDALVLEPDAPSEASRHLIPTGEVLRVEVLDDAAGEAEADDAAMYT